MGAGLPSESNAPSGACVIQSNRLYILWKCGNPCGKTSAKGSWSCSGPSPLLHDVGLVPSGVLFSCDARGAPRSCQPTVSQQPWRPSRQRPDPSIRLAILVSVRPVWPSLDIPMSSASRRHRPSRFKFSRPHSAGTRYERKIAPMIHRRTPRSGGSGTSKRKQCSIRRMRYSK